MQTKMLSTTRVMESPVVDGFSLMQINGTKVHGPPDDWVGPPPSSSCELFIRQIPNNVSEKKLLKLCLKFGKIYQFRVPSTFQNGLRGYAFVRYTNEEDAECALEVLNHCFIQPKRTLNVVNSCEKSCLYISNIQEHITDEEIQRGLRTVFPSMLRAYSASKTHQSNIGRVFVSFATHDEALEAKNSCLGIYRILGDDVRIVWAITERDQIRVFNKSLFFRNVDAKLNYNDIVDLVSQYVNRITIYKLHKVQTNLVIDFTCRQAAETVLQQMQGTVFRDNRFSIKWAKPSARQYLRRIRSTDYDAVLRLKCLANSWNIPVVIFGTHFENIDVQYGAVFLRNTECKLRFIIVTLQCGELVDVHSRLCEVVVSLIDAVGGFPDHNYVFCAQNDFAYLIGEVEFGPFVTFLASHGQPKELSLDAMEIIDLSWACALLAEFSEETLLQVYNNSCKVHTYMSNWIFGLRIFGAIRPKYRSKPPLRHNLDDTQVVLALCHQATGRNSSIDAASAAHNSTDIRQTFHCVLYGGVAFYHRKQQVMTPRLLKWSSSQLPVSGIELPQKVEDMNEFAFYFVRTTLRV